MQVNDLAAWVSIGGTSLVFITTLGSAALLISRLKDTALRTAQDLDRLTAQVDGLRTDVTTRNENTARLETKLEQHMQHDSERFSNTDKGIEDLGNKMQTTFSEHERRLDQVAEERREGQHALERKIEELSRDFREFAKFQQNRQHLQ